MAHQATLTGNHGPGLSMTAKVFNNVSSVKLDFINGVAEVEYDQPVKMIRIALTGVTVVTDTITAGQHAVVIS